MCQFSTHQSGVWVVEGSSCGPGHSPAAVCPAGRQHPRHQRRELLYLYIHVPVYIHTCKLVLLLSVLAIYKCSVSIYTGVWRLCLQSYMEVYNDWVWVDTCINLWYQVAMYTTIRPYPAITHHHLVPQVNTCIHPYPVIIHHHLVPQVNTCIRPYIVIMHHHLVPQVNTCIRPYPVIIHHHLLPQVNTCIRPYSAITHHHLVPQVNTCIRPYPVTTQHWCIMTEYGRMVVYMYND